MIRLLEETYYSCCSVGCRRLKSKNNVIGRVGVIAGSPVFLLLSVCKTKNKALTFYPLIKIQYVCDIEQTIGLTKNSMINYGEVRESVYGYRF